MMNFGILINNANEVLTVESDVKLPRRRKQMSDLGLKIEVSVLIESERIAMIAPLDEIKNEFPHVVNSADVIDARGKIVMPGLIDCHTHLVHGGTREHELNMRLASKSYMDIMNDCGGIHYTMTKTREASFDELYDKTFEHLNEFLRHGITTVEAKSGYGLDLENELK